MISDVNSSDSGGRFLCGKGIWVDWWCGCGLGFSGRDAGCCGLSPLFEFGGTTPTQNGGIGVSTPQKTPDHFLGVVMCTRKAAVVAATPKIGLQLLGVAEPGALSQDPASPCSKNRISCVNKCFITGLQVAQSCSNLTPTCMCQNINPCRYRKQPLYCILAYVQTKGVCYELLIECTKIAVGMHFNYVDRVFDCQAKLSPVDDSAKRLGNFVDVHDTYMLCVGADDLFFHSAVMKRFCMWCVVAWQKILHRPSLRILSILVKNKRGFRAQSRVQGGRSFSGCAEEMKLYFSFLLIFRNYGKSSGFGHKSKPHLALCHGSLGLCPRGLIIRPRKATDLGTLPSSTWLGPSC
ncbi:hypothetical protein VP01_153g5 [Puccinia sorghi]|uniref:Uncharacterized protein n=1 Tax=Puccinia sorghi TaxID=27349 RepID=A0A0L6VIE5_9BASI|nr:hypothetical protein VP01_153g5 [Puccinia sorghi]